MLNSAKSCRIQSNWPSLAGNLLSLAELCQVPFKMVGLWQSDLFVRVFAFRFDSAHVLVKSSQTCDYSANSVDCCNYAYKCYHLLCKSSTCTCVF